MKTLVEGFNSLTTPSKIVFIVLPLTALLCYILYGVPTY